MDDVIRAPAGGLIEGDTFTIAGVYRLRWWKRLLIALRLMKRPAAPHLRQFVVVGSATAGKSR